MSISQIPLSVAIITLNEEKRLPDCLQGLGFAREVVVVDSGSSDRTVALAEESGARVLVEPWRGFGAQKQFALEQCSHQWVLLLDADERIPPETAEQIKTALRGDPRHAAYSFPRKNYFAGRWIRHTGWWPDRVVRLCNRDRCRMSARLVHESLEVDGPVGMLREPIVHHPTSNLREVFDKVNRYSTLGAEELYARGESASVFTAVSRAGWGFFVNYFLRLGILDGRQGLMISSIDAINKFLKYTKLNEMRNRDQR